MNVFVTLYRQDNVFQTTADMRRTGFAGMSRVDQVDYHSTFFSGSTSNQDKSCPQSSAQSVGKLHVIVFKENRALKSSLV